MVGSPRPRRRLNMGPMLPLLSAWKEPLQAMRTVKESFGLMWLLRLFALAIVRHIMAVLCSLLLPTGLESEQLKRMLPTRQI